LSEACVVLGAGHAGAQLVASLRRHGWSGDIVLVGDEERLPYHRPPLSKQYLTGEKSADEILIRPAAAYEKLNVQLRLGARAESIDRARKTIVLANGDELRYDKLALAPGSRPRRIPLPGSDREGVYYLRHVGDVDRIRSHVGPQKRAVIIGGGYIGLEAAASLRGKGVAVTVLEALPRVMQRVTTARVSGFYSRAHAEQGVEVVLGACVEGIEAGAGVHAVTCANGQVHIADLVIIAVGIVPNTELAQASGLTVADGIVVDELARTSDPDIVAAGDCTLHHSAIYGRDVRLESVQNAHEQASVAAATLSGKNEAYRALPWFWSDQYDLKLQIAGLSHGHDEVVIRGDIERGNSFAAFYFGSGRLLAVDAVNRPQEFMFGKKVIAGGIDIDRARLADEGTALKDLLGS
jgi:3-phenylpropionate/trans-cinnamate dioxygenase ferredoxin reductase subunit